MWWDRAICPNWWVARCNWRSAKLLATGSDRTWCASSEGVTSFRRKLISVPEAPRPFENVHKVLFQQIRTHPDDEGPHIERKDLVQRRVPAPQDAGSFWRRGRPCDVVPWCPGFPQVRHNFWTNVRARRCSQNVDGEFPNCAGRDRQSSMSCREEFSASFKIVGFVRANVAKS